LPESQNSEVIITGKYCVKGITRLYDDVTAMLIFIHYIIMDATLFQRLGVQAYPARLGEQ
jgi:ATP:corrinoid adenosyltransferase